MGASPGAGRSDSPACIGSHPCGGRSARHLRGRSDYHRDIWARDAGNSSPPCGGTCGRDRAVRVVAEAEGTAASRD